MRVTEITSTSSQGYAGSFMPLSREEGTSSKSLGEWASEAMDQTEDFAKGLIGRVSELIDNPIARTTACVVVGILVCGGLGFGMGFGMGMLVGGPFGPGFALSLGVVTAIGGVISGVILACGILTEQADRNRSAE